MGYPTNLLCKRNATSPRSLRVLSQSSLFVLFANLTTFGDRWPPLYSFFALRNENTRVVRFLPLLFNAAGEAQDGGHDLFVFAALHGFLAQHNSPFTTGKASLISSFHHAQARIHICSQT